MANIPRRQFLTAVALGSLAFFPATAGAAEPDPREADVRALIERYFKSWSAQDMDRYGACFAPQAVVQLVDPQRGLVTMALPGFLSSQRAAHKNAAHKMVETPETIDVRMEQGLARVVVSWKLVAGDEITYGYDHFTLLPVNGQWRIANLIFYGTDKPE